MHVSTLEAELQAMDVLGFLSFGGKKKLHFYNNNFHFYVTKLGFEIVTTGDDFVTTDKVPF